jgi:hypothetical protein
MTVRPGSSIGNHGRPAPGLLRIFARCGRAFSRGAKPQKFIVNVAAKIAARCRSSRESYSRHRVFENVANTSKRQLGIARQLKFTSRGRHRGGFTCV